MKEIQVVYLDSLINIYWDTNEESFDVMNA